MIFFIVPPAFTLKIVCFRFKIHVKIVELMEKKKYFQEQILILNKTILLA